MLFQSSAIVDVIHVMMLGNTVLPIFIKQSKLSSFIILVYYFNCCCTVAITVVGCVVAICVGCWYGEYVFTSCCGLCCFWKLKCGDLLTCGDLPLVFFGLVLYFTEKFHCLIRKGQKVFLLLVFNLGVEIVAELSWTWSGVLTCTQKCGNHRPHLLELI